MQRSAHSCISLEMNIWSKHDKTIMAAAGIKKCCLYVRVTGGELFARVAECERLSEEEASNFVEQILLGVKHMHDLGVVHLDLKSSVEGNGYPE
ncbi:hypothetical protein X801_04779 [Opisthorchis viverrini]|uniref:Protein kinase domain-containing protein n=1 Tax=Opisthorchis viverrini TaxID=6198 RepID=A0A1S8WY73_OPIVI|nr:hypothetical protein X801_04779 [Opisthorchis viverrini]